MTDAPSAPSAIAETAFARGALVLTDGSRFEGTGFGAEGVAVGEVCFNTAMTGYQEILTDPSYMAQIVAFTFPHVGNVGTNALDVEQISRLSDAWGVFEQRLQRIITAEGPKHRMIDDEDVARLLDGLKGQAPREELIQVVESWELEPIARRFARLSQQAFTLAGRTSRSLEVKKTGEDVRVPRLAWAPFWSAAVHVVRNAVCHGFEPREERVQAGKPARGVLELRAERADGWLKVSFIDDGRGVNWQRVAEKARDRGLPADSPAELSDALFHDGLTTAEKNDDLAGRGVGLAAAREACERLGGTVRVQSPLGPRGGTMVCFTLPESRRCATQLARGYGGEKS